MTQTATKPQTEPVQPAFDDARPLEEQQEGLASEWMVARLRLLWEKRRLLYKAAVAGLLVGTLLAFAIPKRYESTAQLMPPDSQSSSTAAIIAAMSARTGGLGPIAGDLLGMKSSGALFMGILRSRTVKDRLIERFDLKKVYAVRLDEKARLELEENTAISEDRKSGILKITVTDRDPRRAAAMAQAYVEELDRLVAKLTTSAARREREFLEDRLKTVQADLETAEKNFSVFASTNRAIDIKEQGKAMVEAAATLQGQLIAAKSKLEGLKQIYSDNNARVRSADAEVSELQKELNRLGGKDENSSAVSGPQGDPIYPSLRKLPLLGVTFADLYRQTKVQEAVFEALRQQYELAKVQEAKETPSVKVLDEPRVPERKSSPPRLLIMTICTTLAFVSVGIFTLGRASWAQIDQADPGKILALEVFGTVNKRMPWASPNGSQVQAVAHRVWMRFADRNGAADDAADQLK